MFKHFKWPIIIIQMILCRLLLYFYTGLYIFLLMSAQHTTTNNNYNKSMHSLCVCLDYYSTANLNNALMIMRTIRLQLNSWLKAKQRQRHLWWGMTSPMHSALQQSLIQGDVCEVHSKSRQQRQSWLVQFLRCGAERTEALEAKYEHTSQWVCCQRPGVSAQPASHSRCHKTAEVKTNHLPRVKNKSARQADQEQPQQVLSFQEFWI